MTHKFILITVCIATLLTTAAIATADNPVIPEYIGSQACLGCHAEKFILAEKRADTCTACHKKSHKKEQAAFLQGWQGTFSKRMESLQSDLKMHFDSMACRPLTHFAYFCSIQDSTPFGICFENSPRLGRINSSMLHGATITTAQFPASALKTKCLQPVISRNM